MLDQPLDLLMSEDIIGKVQVRIDKFGEAWSFALKVILLGYGDEFRMAYCITNDWKGPKHQLASDDDDFPVCPTCGNVCTESQKAPRLVLVPE